MTPVLFRELGSDCGVGSSPALASRATFPALSGLGCGHQSEEVRS